MMLEPGGRWEWLRSVYVSIMFSWCHFRHNQRKTKSVHFKKYVHTILYENVSMTWNLMCSSSIVLDSVEVNSSIMINPKSANIHS